MPCGDCPPRLSRLESVLTVTRGGRQERRRPPGRTLQGPRVPGCRGPGSRRSAGARPAVHGGRACPLCLPHLCQDTGVPPLPGLLAGGCRVAWFLSLLEGGAREDPPLSTLRARSPRPRGGSGVGTSVWRGVQAPGWPLPPRSLCALVLGVAVYLAEGPAVVRKVPSSVSPWPVWSGQCTVTRARGRSLVLPRAPSG